MSQLCKQCGERLDQHKDGQCDPITKKRYNRKVNAAYNREALESLGVIKVRGSQSGRTYYE